MVPTPPPSPVDELVAEARRLAALRSLQVLDTPPEPVFDAIAASAAQVCGVPIALISLLDAGRQWFKANVGLEAAGEIARDVAFCDHAIRADAPFEVPDAARDPRFAGNPLVTGAPGIRFYAGAPIALDGGERVGTVCVIDRDPRRLDEQQRTMLESLARIAGITLQQRRDLLDMTRRLADSEQRSRRLYEATPAVMHSIDPQGRLLDVSDRWLALLGYRREEVLGRRSSDFLTPASREKAAGVLPAFFRAGRCDRVSYQFVRSDGQVVDILLSATLERGPDGAALRSLAVLEDVTAQRRLEAELGRTHAHLDAVVDNMPALVGFWDADGITRLANRDFQSAVGLPVDKIIGCPLRQVVMSVDPEGYEALAPHVAAVLEGRRQEFECAMLTTSGLRQMRVALVPAQPEAGRIDGFYGTWIDITGMKSLALRQRDSERLYRALQENLHSAYALHEIEVDTLGTPVDYRYLAVNPAFCAMVGIEAADVVGRRVTAVFPHVATDPAGWIGRFGRVALTGEAMRFEQRSVTTGRWYEIAAYRPEAGQFAIVATDITGRRRLEEELAEAPA
jgi:PAS domain S-box-containing protein